MEIKKSVSALTLAVMAGVAFQACRSDVELPETPTPPTGGGSSDIVDESDYFDFKTQSEFTLNLDFGPFAANALLSVFVANPYKVDGERIYIAREADFMIFADENGRFSGKANLPSYADKLWVMASAFGMPAATEVEVENGVLNYTLTAVDDEPDTQAAAPTRAQAKNDFELTYTDTDESNRLYSYVKWNNNGSLANGYNNMVSHGTISPDEFKALRSMLWHNKAEKPGWQCDVEDRLNNSYLFHDNINVNIVEDNAKIYVTLLDENTGQLNNLGYYFYKTDGGDPAASGGLADVDKYILFPNVTVKNRTYPSNNCPFKTYAEDQQNRRVRLLFVDEDGTVKETFPKGYTIGFFSMMRGWEEKKYMVKVKYAVPFKNNNTDKTHKGFLYTNDAWNYCPWERCVFDNGWKDDYLRKDLWNMPNLRKAFISVKSDDALFFGLEDSFDDLGYDDMIFAVQAEPSNAIEDDDRPELEDEGDGDVIVKQSKYYTYAYEDLWPNRGDYDLNDVIVRHKREIEFNGKNEVLKVVDTFTPVQPEGAATLCNAFAVRFLGGLEAKTTDKSDHNIVFDNKTNSYILFGDANACRNKDFSITRTFDGLSKTELESESVDPFLIPRYVATDNYRYEVHLPMFKPTDRINPALPGTADDHKYVDKDGAFPFALSLPIEDYKPSKEGVRIDETYGLFKSWVESGSEIHADWYLHYDE